MRTAVSIELDATTGCTLTTMISRHNETTMTTATTTVTDDTSMAVEVKGKTEIEPSKPIEKETSLECEDDENSFLNNDSSVNGYHSESGSSCGHLNNSSGETKPLESSIKNTEKFQQQTIDQKQQQLSDEPEQMRKLFIGGLDYKTSEITLKEHFEKYGDVIDCIVMREPQSKRSRGFGFVIYANSLMVDRAQAARPHEIDGREVQSKRAISREESGKPESQATVDKVYLGGLSDDIGDLELRDYFKDFGNILDINIAVHKDTGKRRGFAFVKFDDYDTVDKIVLMKFHTIKDKRFEAKKAISKAEMDARKMGPRAAMPGAMMGLAGPPLDGARSRPGRNGGACLWESGGHYGSSNYPNAYLGQTGLNGFLPHYHAHSAHYGPGWMMHGGQSGGAPYGFRGTHGPSAYGRNGHTGPADSWAPSADYGSFPPAQSGASGGGGPMRVSYQHRGWGPYGTGYGSHRGRGYHP